MKLEVHAYIGKIFDKNSWTTQMVPDYTFIDFGKAIKKGIQIVYQNYIAIYCFCHRKKIFLHDKKFKQRQNHKFGKYLPQI